MEILRMLVLGLLIGITAATDGLPPLVKPVVVVDYESCMDLAHKTNGDKSQPNFGKVTYTCVRFTNDDWKDWENWKGISDLAYELEQQNLSQ